MNDGAADPGRKGALRDGVVLLHGISRTSRSFRKMQAAIEGCGFATLNLGYASRRKALEQLAEDIHPAIEGFAAGIEGSIHFVGHSMGGLLTRAYLGKYRPKQLITQRDAALDAILPPVDYPVGIIAGNRSIYPISSAFLPKPHDGRVSVENTRLDGMIDHVVIAVSHPSLVRNRLALQQTIAFLRDGRFKSDDCKP